MFTSNFSGGRRTSAAGNTIVGNTLTHNENSTTHGAPDYLGGGQIYVSPGINVSVLNNTADGQWSDSNQHSYGIEVDNQTTPTYVPSSSILTFGNHHINNSVDGIWVNKDIGPVAIENETISGNGTSGIDFFGPAAGQGAALFNVSSTNNDTQTRTSPYPSLAGWGVILESTGMTNAICIQNNSNLSGNHLGAFTPSSLPNPSVCSGPMLGTIYPSNGSGASHTFTSLVHIGGTNLVPGYQDLQFIQVFFSSIYPINSTKSCHMEYVRSTNTLYMDADNGGNNWVAHAVIGSGGGIIGNTQCQVNTALSSATQSGAHVLLNLDVTSLTGFGTTQPIYIYQSETDNSNNTTSSPTA